MGLLDGLKNWLSPKKSTQDLIIQLKVFSEMLDLSTQEIREKAQSYRNKAVKYAKQGDRTRARQYLKLYHQFSAQAMGMEEYKANLDLLTAHLEEASVMKQSINAIREIRSTLKGIILSLPSIPSLQKEARKLNKMVEQLGTVREETIKLHTAAHLLLESLRRVLGNHVYQKGSNINAERLRFDFSHPDKLTDEEKQKVEDLVNEQIQKNLPVSFKEMALEDAKRIGAMGVFEAKYGKKVKVYTIGKGDNVFSREICGGPHVKNTSELGKFKIKKEQSSGAGVRRIKAVLDS